MTTDTLPCSAATIIGPRIVGIVAFANVNGPSKGATVKLDQAGAVARTPMIPWTTAEIGAVPHGWLIVAWGTPKDSVVIVALYTRISLHQEEASHFVSALTNADPSSLGYLAINSSNMDM